MGGEKSWKKAVGMGAVRVVVVVVESKKNERT